MPSIRTTVVGSYPVPEWLRAYPTRGALRDAVMVVLKTQELAGIDVLGDGELSRFDVNHPETNGMIDYFVRRLGNVRTALGRQECAAFQREAGLRYRAEPAGIAEGKVTEGTLNLPHDFALGRALTQAPLKFTVTSPYMLAKLLLLGSHRDRQALTLNLAEVLAAQMADVPADVLQIDEANLPGHPEDSSWAAEAINRVLDTCKGERGVHLCFGNYGGQRVQAGDWRTLLPFCNALRCDHLVLEFARHGYDELAVFRDLKPEIALGIGVIDIKDNVIESPSEVARRIELAVKTLGRDRIRWVHPDCGFWMLPRNVADGKMRALVLGRDQFEGK